VKEDLVFDAEECRVEPSGSHKVTIRVDQANISEILDQIGVEKVLKHFGDAEMLTEIGRENCIAHFNLEQ
jgi:hypothetical protein